ncbi:MAG: AI-2E family transporter, partial [Clostridia bacterium]|nr:AI-2E family transporter [Clostridia bacterium]
IQQVDGNIIGPKIVGNAIGIKSLWVVISITIMGSFFGFVGMLIGAPLFSVLYTIVKEHTERRLKERNLPTETSAYADLNPLTVFEESVGMTPEHFTETVEASLPAKPEEPEPDGDLPPADETDPADEPSPEESPAVQAEPEPNQGDEPASEPHSDDETEGEG